MTGGPKVPKQVPLEYPPLGAADDASMDFSIVFVGFVLGAGAVGLGSIVPWMTVFIALLRGQPAPLRWVCVGIFAALAVCCGLRIRWLQRRGRLRRGRSLGAGFLIGVGIASLVEGACFTFTGM
jgi:hypothetical protein